MELPGVVLLCGVWGCAGAACFGRVVRVGRPDPVPPAPSPPLRRLLNLSSPVVALATLPPPTPVYWPGARAWCVDPAQLHQIWQVPAAGRSSTGLVHAATWWWVGGALGWCVSLAGVVLGSYVSAGGVLATGGQWCSSLQWFADVSAFSTSIHRSAAVRFRGDSQDCRWQPWEVACSLRGG